MFCYLLDGKILISQDRYADLPEIPEQTIMNRSENVYILTAKNPSAFRRSFSASDPSLVFLKEEGVNLLMKSNDEEYLPDWLKQKILSRQAMVINTAYPNWKDVLDYRPPEKWRINIVGLGDVGGILLTGLRLLGGKAIGKVGIFDTDMNKVNRWNFEANQIFSQIDDEPYPEVEGISESQLFDCDMFVFCVSTGVPPVGQEQQDVRLVQFGGNARIVNYYAKVAREKSYKGIFAVVSDPVDLLCKSAFLTSNTDETGKRDFLGLAPEQIRGYGLGIMHARAVFFAQKEQRLKHYLQQGRAYGPHGEGLVIADSITDYNDELSRLLTDRVSSANLDVRRLGYKPYIAPALSSGALSLIATMKGNWHYSATFMGGIFMGAKNRLTASGVEIERLDLPPRLVSRLQQTYQLLGSYLK